MNLGGGGGDLWRVKRKRIKNKEMNTGKWRYQMLKSSKIV